MTDFYPQNRDVCSTRSHGPLLYAFCLCFYFKITHVIEGLDSGMFFKYRTDNGTRGHSWALAKERCKLDIRKYAFFQRTINEWNRLPGECVNATSVNMFKNKIDNYFKRSGYV